MYEEQQHFVEDKFVSLVENAITYYVFLLGMVAAVLCRNVYNVDIVLNIDISILFLSIVSSTNPTYLFAGLA